MINNRLSLPLNIIVGFLAVVGVGAAVGHFFLPSISPAADVFPLIITIHAVLGGIYLAFAPFQFVKRIRSRWLNFHRWTGRILVTLGMVSGATGLTLAWVFPFAGWPERVILGFFGLLLLVSLGKGFLHIRARQVMQHREWMIRAFAIGLAIATARLISVPANVLFNPDPQQAEIIAIVSFTVAFSLHSIIAEVWIRATRRKKRVPVAGAARTAAQSS